MTPQERFEHWDQVARDAMQTVERAQREIAKIVGELALFDDDTKERIHLRVVRDYDES